MGIWRWVGESLGLEDHSLSSELCGSARQRLSIYKGRRHNFQEHSTKRTWVDACSLSSNHRLTHRKKKVKGCTEMELHLSITLLEM